MTSQFYKSFYTSLHSYFGKLPPDISYFGASKQDFLKQLEEKCHYFEVRNENLSIKNIPVGSNQYYLCRKKSCTAMPFFINKDEKGSINEVYHQFEDSLQEEFENDSLIYNEDGEYIPEEGIYKFKEPDPCTIYFKTDERLNFHSSKEYLNLKNACDAACREFVPLNSTVIFNPKMINDWCYKHQDLHKVVAREWNYKAFDEFRKLYDIMKSHCMDIEQVEKAKHALNELPSFSNQEIGNWLSVNACLFYMDIQHKYSNYKICDNNGKSLKSYKYENWYYKGEEFFVLYDFCSTFKKVKNLLSSR